jgi:hypothetical protein
MIKNNIGFYSGFLIFSFQVIAGDIYRNYKQREHENKIKLLFKKLS